MVKKKEIISAILLCEVFATVASYMFYLDYGSFWDAMFFWNKFIFVLVAIISVVGIISLWGFSDYFEDLFQRLGSKEDVT